MASPIRLRAAAERCRFRPSGLPAGLPLLLPLPFRASMALLRRSRSASNSAMIDCVSKVVSLPALGMAANSTAKLPFQVKCRQGKTVLHSRCSLIFECLSCCARFWFSALHRRRCASTARDAAFTALVALNLFSFFLFSASSAI